MRKSVMVLILTVVAALGFAAAQESELRIGTLTPLTGAGSPYGPGMQQAIELAVKHINEAGGINGTMIRLFSEDGQAEPEAAVRAAQKLIEVNRVSAIIGTWSSGVTMAVAPLAIEANVILMNTSGAPEITTLDDNNLVWRAEASNVLYGEAFAFIAHQLGITSASTMAFNNPSGRGNTREFARVFSETGGKVMAEVVYNPEQSTYRAELEQALAGSPDAIVMGSYLPDTTIVLKEWFQLFGDDVKWIAPAWAVNADLVSALGADVVEGVYGVGTVSSFGSTAYEEFKAAYTAATGNDPATNSYAAMVYDMTISLGLAMVAGNSTDPLVAKDFLRDVTNAPGVEVTNFADGVAALQAGQQINYEGASSRVDFDENGDVRPNFGLYQVQNGQVVRIDIIDLDAQ